MSGPYCETCRFFQPQPFASEGHGLCMDATKIIYDRNGNRWNEPPATYAKNDCRNHTIEKETP